MFGMVNPTKISRAELFKFATIDRPRFGRLITKTVPDLLKTNNPHIGNIFKLTDISVIFGADYSNLVNNARIKETWAAIEEEAAANGHTFLPDVVKWAESERIIRNGEFDVDAFNAKPRQWGKKVPNTTMVHHVKDGVDKYYFDLCVLSCSNRIYVDGLGNTINDNDVKPFERKVKEGARQELETPVIWRTYGFDSVVGLKVNGKWYEVKC